MDLQNNASKNHRLERYNELAGMVLNGKSTPRQSEEQIKKNVALDCGWGRLLFGQTFDDHDALVDQLINERKSCRDIAIYIRDHHVLLARAPELLFIDPSDTYRFWLHLYRAPKWRSKEFTVRMLKDGDDARAINRIYRKCGMIEAPEEKILENQHTRVFCYYLAERIEDGAVIGTISGIDHKLAFNDPTNGSSFWCLSVDPDSRTGGVGRTLIREVAEHFIARGRDYLDLSVMHDNRKAKNLYRKLGFRQVPVYAIKRKNEVNRSLYLGGPRP